MRIQLNMYAKVRTGLDWWVCSFTVGAMTNPKAYERKGDGDRGSMTELRQNVSGGEKMPSGAFWTSIMLPRPFFLVADDSRRLWTTQLESCGS